MDHWLSITGLLVVTCLASSSALLEPAPRLYAAVADAPPPEPQGFDRPKAQCSAACITKTLDLELTPSDLVCNDTADCLKCWKTCKKLIDTPVDRDDVCNGESCGFGCTTACNLDLGATNIFERWEFLSQPTLKVIDDENLEVTWETPIPDKAITRQPRLVYTLLYLEDGASTWTALFMTIDREALIKGPHRQIPGLAFQLMATSENGTVAVVPIPYISRPRTVPPKVGNAIPPWDPSLFMERVDSSKVYRPVGEPLFPGTAEDQPGKISSLSVFLKRMSDGSLSSEVKWTQEIVSQGPVMYVIGWGLINCNVDNTRPHCHLPEDQSFTELPPQQTSEMRVQLGHMVYNAKYWLDVSFSGHPAKRLHFYTPPCHNIDPTFTRCADRAHPTTTAPPRYYPQTLTPVRDQSHSTPSQSQTSADPSSPSHDQDLARRLINEFLASSSSEQDPGLSVDTILTIVAVGVGFVLLGLLAIAAHARFTRPNTLALAAKARRMQSCQSLAGYLHNPGPGSSASLHRVHHYAVGQSPLHPQRYLCFFPPPPAGQLPLNLPVDTTYCVPQPNVAALNLPVSPLPQERHYSASPQCHDRANATYCELPLGDAMDNVCYLSDSEEGEYDASAQSDTLNLSASYFLRGESFVCLDNYSSNASFEA